MNRAAFQPSPALASMLLALMLLVAALTWWVKPTQLMSAQRGALDLQAIVPTSFGDWTELPLTGQQIVNPQQVEVLNRLYSQTLARVYVNAQGQAVMLSIAYGARQTDSLALHYPESCYPAQGFQVERETRGELPTAQGVLPVTRLLTQLGRRVEPVTYWATVGNFAVRRGLDTKLRQVRYGLSGQVPDGLIFRVSTVSGDVAAGYRMQDAFVNQLLPRLLPRDRQLLAGL